MKILHTSDWHLGHTLYGYDRTLEQESMLRQIETIVKERKPDVFILSGDVYHTSQPSASVQTMFSKAMVAIHEANPDMPIIVTAGNHDSGSRHDIFQIPWKALNVYTIGGLDKEHLENHIIEIPGKGYVVAVPYWYERNIPEGFFQSLLDIVKERNSSNLPVVMTAHTTVEGFDPSGHERATDYSAGGIDCVKIDYFGEGYDYLALGHIHHAQTLRGTSDRIRYSGTPIPVSFDEVYESSEHGVSLVEIASHGDIPSIEKIAIENPIPLVSLPSKGEAVTWDEAKRILREYPDDILSYIRLNVKVEDYLPTGASEEAGNICKGKRCRFCLLNARRESSKDADSDSSAISVIDFLNMEPIEIAKRFCSDMNLTFDSEMEELFESAYKEANEDKRND